ncbi:MAG: T9SS type A sorting domain-containing protein [Ignavibacteria bacterium]|nr:T9SS type A sorting domain-containing protein [Ignavibacteria bacterium]
MKTNFKHISAIIIFILFFSASYAQQGWFQQTSNTQNDIYNIKFFNENTGIAIGMSRTVLRTTNGGNSWQPITLPVFPNGTAAYFFPLKNTTTGWISGSGWNGVYRAAIMKTTNAGVNWGPYINYTGEAKQLYFLNDLMGWAIVSPPRILRTEEGGGWWESCYIGYNYSFIMKGIIFTDSLNGYVYGFDTTAKKGSLLKTANSGANWIYTVSDYPYSFNSVYFINSQTGYIACDSGRILKTTSAFSNFEVLTPRSLKNLSSIQFINSQTGWAVGVDYSLQVLGLVMKTTNGGNNWSSYMTGGSWLYDVDFVNQQTGWACGWFGTILKSTNGGSVYAGGNNTTVPSEFVLSQNYPNPFNPSTIISYQLPITNFIKLAVYDITGKEVAVLVNEIKKAGFYETEYDGSNIASGIYYYQLSVDNKPLATKKMVLIK